MMFTVAEASFSDRDFFGLNEDSMASQFDDAIMTAPPGEEGMFLSNASGKQDIFTDIFKNIGARYVVSTIEQSQRLTF